MEQELIPYLDERFRETSRQIAELREEMVQRFEQVDKRFEAAEDTARQTLVQLEGLRHEVHLIAEGFLGLDDRLKRASPRAGTSRPLFPSSRFCICFSHEVPLSVSPHRRGS